MPQDNLQTMHLQQSLFTILFALLLVACGTPEPAQVTGTWTGEVISSRTTDLSLTLAQTEMSVTGSAVLGTLEFGVSGSVSGSNLSLNYSEREESISLNGRVSGDRFSGVITTANNGEETASGNFVLERQPEAVEQKVSKSQSE